jgi:hypothetical protein
MSGMSPKWEGDGAGYDIQSYKSDGKAKYIEVKTTTGGPNTPFFVTLNELALSQEHAADHYLYRLYLLDRQTHRTKYYVVNGVLSGSFTLEPIAFRAIRRYR